MELVVTGTWREALRAHADPLRPAERVSRAGLGIHVVTTELRVPRVRGGSRFSSRLEPRERAERAWVAVVQGALLQGASTRRWTA